MQKKISFKLASFKLSVVALAVTAAFPAANAFADDEVAELTSPNQYEIGLNLGYVSAKDNSWFNQYRGYDSEADGFNGSVDLNLVNRNDETGSWFKLQGKNLGLTTVEVETSYEKQGNWSIGLSYNQIPHYSPYTVYTNVGGIGSKNIVQPALDATATKVPAATHQVSLSTERDISTFTASKYLTDKLKFSFQMKNEDKTGTRMDGFGGAAAGGAKSIDANFLFTPEPIDQQHQQFDAVFDYTGDKYQITAGYYGSFLETANDSLTITPSGQIQARGGNVGTAGSVAPIALAPDNEMQQFYVSGGYNFSSATRATLKYARSTAKQTDSFISRTALQSGIGSNLDAEVNTDEATATASSRLTKDLNLSGSWRYEKKEDKTPVRVFQYSVASGGAVTSYTNNPDSYEKNNGKLDADYKLGDSGYALKAGIDYREKTDKEWAEVLTALGRGTVTETTYRIGARKDISEVVGGSVTYSIADRTGSSFDDGKPEMAPTFLADRTENKVRGVIDWVPSAKTSVQLAAEYLDDKYKPGEFGLDSGNGYNLSLDFNYAFNSDWKMNGWVSYGATTSKQTALGADCTATACAPRSAAGLTTDDLWTKWDAKLQSSTSTLGLSFDGTVSTWDLGAKWEYANDENSQDVSGLPATVITCTSSTSPCPVANQVTSAPAAGMGDIPNTKFTTNTVGLYARYHLSKKAAVRLSYLYNQTEMDDWTWKNWQYADGTRVYQRPTETTQIFGVALGYSF